MRIAFITGIESSGGAARAAVRLHDALATLPGVELLHLTGRPDRPGSGAVGFAEPGPLRGAVEDAARRFGRADAAPLRRRRAEANRRNLLRLTRAFRPDVISLHNLNPWCGLELSRTIAAELAEIAPVAWRMPDMWPLTGCCSYADFCERPAGTCPHPAVLAAVRAGTTPAGPAAAERARLLAAGRRLALVSPSAWLAGLAREYFANGLRVEHIPSGLDLSFWKPVDRAAARRALDLPDAARWVFFIADHAELPLKGGAPLREAVSLLPGTRLLTAGRLRRDSATAWPEGTVHLGAVSDDRLLRLAYSAADVTVVPSLAENLPGVALESIACGTPCAGFAVGGIPDVIQSGRTGALAANLSASALADAISAAAGVHADALAEARESLDARARALQHRRLYQDLTGA